MGSEAGPVPQAPPAQARAALAALIAAQLGLHACMTGVRMAAPLLVLDRGYPSWAAGAVLALFSLAPVLLALPAGRMADRHGYHRPVGIGVGLCMVGAALSAVAAWTMDGALPRGMALALLCVGAVLCGAGANAGLIAVQRTGGRLAVTPGELKRVFSWLGLAPSLSNVVGPLMAGILIDTIGHTGAFFGLMALPLWAVLWSRRVPREVPRRVARQGSTLRNALDLLRLPLMRRLLLVNWALSASWDLHALLVPVLGHERGLSASAIGAVLAAFAATVAAVRLLVPRVADHLREGHVLRWAMCWTAGVFAGYPFAHSAWGMAAWAVLLGLALGVVQPMVMSMLHQITPHERHGEAIGLRSLAINISGSAMPLAFGMLSAALGASWVFWGMAALVLAASSRASGLRIGPV